MNRTTISKATIRRFGVYIQALESLGKESRVVSSDRLAAACGLHPGLIRKDLAWYGGIGRRGSGYEVHALLSVIKHTLSVDRIWRVAVVEPTVTGRALLPGTALAQRGFEVSAVFSSDCDSVGERYGALEVHPLRMAQEIVPRLGIEIGVIATAPEHAQYAADTLVRAGVYGLLCYAPVRISSQPGVFVIHVDVFQPFFTVAHALGLGDPDSRAVARRRNNVFREPGVQPDSGPRGRV
jgi:redox-sensing transcriptional repressor